MLDIRKIEKKDIFKYSTVIGACLLLNLFLQIAFSNILVYVLISNGYSQTEAASFITNVSSGYLINTIISAIVMIIPGIIILKSLHLKAEKTCSFNSPNNNANAFLSVGMIVGVSMIANIVTSILISIMSNVFNVTPVSPQIGDGTYSNSFEFVYVLICSAFVPALLEEFAFRGVILGSLRKFGDTPAVFISALLFALLHGNFVQMPFAFIVGVALGYAVIITDSIWPAIIGHLINNAFACFSTELPQRVISAIFFIFVLFGIYSIVNLIKRKHYIVSNDVPSTFSKSQRFFKMLCSPTVIIFIISMLFEAIFYLK